MRVCVWGLGSMGSGMALSLLRAGHEVSGADPCEEARAAFEAEGGAPAGAPGAVDAAVLVVVNSAQTEAVLFGEGGLAAELRAGAVVLGCATVDPDFARSVEARLGEQGILYLDAPISGGAAKARQGALTVMASGAPAAFEAARPLLDAMAETVFELGDAAGPGSAMKVVNQMLAGIHIAAMGEAMGFGLSMGIEPAKTLEVISRCAGTSWMFENRGAHVAGGDYAPRSAVEIFVKDLGIVQDAARARRYGAPLSAAALQRFLEASGMGLGGEDDAAVAKVYARAAGLTLPGKALPGEGGA